MQESLEVVRKQVFNPKDKLILNYMIKLPKSEPAERKMIRVDEPINAIAVQIDRQLVFLPPVDSDDKFYESFSEFLKGESPSSNLTGMQWDFPMGPEFHIDLSTT